MDTVVNKPAVTEAAWEIVAAGDACTLGKVQRITPLGASFELSAISAANGTAESVLVGLILTREFEAQIDSFTLDAASVGPVLAIGVL